MYPVGYPDGYVPGRLPGRLPGQVPGRLPGQVPGRVHTRSATRPATRSATRSATQTATQTASAYVCTCNQCNLLFFRHTLVFIISFLPTTIFAYNLVTLNAPHTCDRFHNKFFSLGRSNFLTVGSNGTLVISITHAEVRSSFIQINGHIRAGLCPRYQPRSCIYNLYLLSSFPVSNARRVSVLTEVARLTVARHKQSLAHPIQAFRFAIPRL